MCVCACVIMVLLNGINFTWDYYSLVKPGRIEKELLNCIGDELPVEVAPEDEAQHQPVPGQLEGPVHRAP